MKLIKKIAIVLAIVGLIGIGAFFFHIFSAGSTISFIEGQTQVGFPESYTEEDAKEYNGSVVAYLRIGEARRDSFRQRNGFVPVDSKTYSKLARQIGSGMKSAPKFPAYENLLCAEGETDDGRDWGMLFHLESGGLWAFLRTMDAGGL